MSLSDFSAVKNKLILILFLKEQFACLYVDEGTYVKSAKHPSKAFLLTSHQSCGLETVDWNSSEQKSHGSRAPWRFSPRHAHHSINAGPI